MGNLEAVKSAILNLDGRDITSTKIAAVNNKVRLLILEILRDFHNGNLSDNILFKKARNRLCFGYIQPRHHHCQSYLEIRPKEKESFFLI